MNKKILEKIISLRGDCGLVECDDCPFWITGEADCSVRHMEHEDTIILCREMLEENKDEVTE